MTARKKEFFEAFQNENLGKRSSQPASQNRRPPGPSKPSKRRSENASSHSVNRNNLTGAIVAVIALLIVSFVLGFVAGRRGQSEDIVMVDDSDIALLSGVDGPDDAEDDAEPAEPLDLPRVFYKLQIVGGINASSAEDLVNFLQHRGYRPSATRQGNRYTVYVGEFESPNSPQAQALKEKFTNMEYQGRRQFSDCLFIRFERED